MNVDLALYFNYPVFRHGMPFGDNFWTERTISSVGINGKERHVILMATIDQSYAGKMPRFSQRILLHSGDYL